MAKKKQRKRTCKAKKSDRPKTLQERDAILAFLTTEMVAPNNTQVDIDFNNPQGLDEELNAVIKKEKIKRDRVGRPTKMTEPTLRKLKVAFLIDCTDPEACKFAGIGESTLYDFQKEHPEFSELKTKWKETYIIASRLNVFRSVIQKNIDDSWRVLKAKRKHEFAEKTIVEEQHVVSTDELDAIAKGDYEAIAENNDNQTATKRHPDNME